MGVPKRKTTAILGTLTKQVQDLDKKHGEDLSALDLNARQQWREQEESGKSSIVTEKQSRHPPDVDETLVGQRIEMLSWYEYRDMPGGAFRWCGGKVKRACDGTWLKPNARTVCYKKGEAAEIEWDPIPELDLGITKSIEPLDPRKWNKQDVDKARRKDFGKPDYGL